MNGRLVYVVLCAFLAVVVSSPSIGAGSWNDILQYGKRFWHGLEKPTIFQLVQNSEESSERSSEGSSEGLVQNSEESLQRSSEGSSEGNSEGSSEGNSEGSINETMKKGVCPNVVSREEWGAKEPKGQDNITSLPVPFVILHHTYQPSFCETDESCRSAMRTMQHMHQDIRGWFDIGYNFCVGGSGKIYEGRGWDIQGAHAPRYNTRSTGICFIGDFMERLPTPEMVSAVKALIECGVKRGSIDPDYKLLGHRQVRETLCPGDQFYQEITTWPHWDPMQDVVHVTPSQ